MILGFISLLLTFGQNYIVQICIPEEAADTMLPCLKEVETEEGETHHRRLLWGMPDGISLKHRMLVEASANPHCSKGKVPLITLHGLHQLHIFIFFLAIFHVFYSALTMAFGRAKIHGWKEWEKETLSLDYEFSNDPSRFRFSHETSFVRQHTSFWNRIPISFYTVSFFRQFFISVGKADYLAMRHGFITVHLAPGSKFDFQKYIERSLEDDFKVIVGISPILWASAVLFLLVNVEGGLLLFWISVIPLITILAVGTKLQAIITRMALEIKERHAVIQGIPLVQLSDHHFWFGRPQFILFLIHFTLFQNAFQLIYLIWIWVRPSISPLFFFFFALPHDSRFCRVAVQVLCSYITLPLYALMGSHMKRSIFDEQTSKALKKWHQAVKKKNPKGSGNSPSRSPNTSPKGSPKATTVHPIPHFKATGISPSPSRRRHLSDQGLQYATPEVLSAPAVTATPNPAFAAPTDLLTGSAEQKKPQAVGDSKEDEEYSFINLTEP
ncbi:hypothetical protein MUK42_35682 [Musa troglodytarum]|uniref:MLO-like protein n=1 Tax=Musa troglodytarum TaxID=320322 RepID=A0A9E7KUY9_9LILI|nr:hypothetical protein MUK42_35682 [Musa troglodytarum]